MMKRILSGVLIIALLGTSTPFAFADVVAAPVAGDLMHLTFTATSGLWVKLVSPLPGSVAASPATAVEAAVGMGQGVEIMVNGEVVSTKQLGKRVVDGPAKETRYTFYGVPLQPGANRLTLTPLGAAKSRGASTEVTIYGPGRPASLQVEVSGKAVADGSSLLLLRVKALDQWGHPALAGALVKAVIVSGDTAFLPPAAATAAPSPSASGMPVPTASGIPVPAASGSSLVPAASASPVAAAQRISLFAKTTQSIDLLLGSGGVASVSMIAGLTSGDVVVHLSADDLKLDRKFFLAPNVRAPMVLGLATIGAGSVPAAPGEDPTEVDGADTRTGRIALYATGNVGHQILGTLAYDTADELTRTSGFGAFGQGDALADRPYDIVGDTSVPRDDALSNDHMYLRFDRNRSSAIWGEFQAQTGSTYDSGDGFNLLVDGAKVELASSASKVMVFNAHDQIAYARQIFNPLGLATLGNLLNGNIVVGSDVVTLVTISRSTGAIISQTALTQNVDYSIDYNTGQIRFINIPMPFDSNFNPNEIVVQYEYDGTGGAAQTTGGRFETVFGHAQKEHVSIGYVNDTYGSGNFSLLSENLGGALPGGTWSVEHLTSNGIIAGDQATQVLGMTGTNGDAIRLAAHAGGTINKFDLGYDSTTNGFDNPFGGLSTPGLMDYHAGYTYTPRGNHDQLTFTFSHAQNTGTAESTSQSQAALLWKDTISKRFSLKAGLTAVTGPGEAAPAASAVPSAPTAAPTAMPASAMSVQGDIGFDWKLFPKIDLNVDHTQDIGGSVVASQPGQTNAELGLASTKGRAYVRETWSEAPLQSFANATSALTTPVSGTHAFAVGFQRSAGKNTDIDSEYSVEQTSNGNNIYSSMGVAEKLEFSKHLHGTANLQRAIGIGSGAQGFNLYGTTMSYDLTRLRATGSYQLRTGDGGGSSMRLGATGALSSDISLIALVDNSSAGGLLSSDQRVGLSYRPANNDRGATLLQYNLQNSTSAQLGTHAATISLDQLFRPTARLELGGRYAYELDGDSYYPAQTQLFGFRAIQRVGDRFDVGSEMRYLDVRAIPGASATGFALETGVRLGNEMRFAGGYNFSSTPDPALAAAPKRRGVYVTMTTVVDRLLGWGR